MPNPINLFWSRDLCSLRGWTDRDTQYIYQLPLFSVHRARLFVRGKAEKRLTYLLHFAFDRIGADEYAMLQGKPLNAQRPVGVQDALFQYNYGKGKLRLTGGFFRPQVGRESNTPIPMVPNHEPALTSTLARRLSVGAGHGRASGINLGGRISVGGTSMFLYNIGTFAPVTADTSDEKKFTSSQAKSLPHSSRVTLCMRPVTTSSFAQGLLVTPNPWDEGFGLLIGASGAVRGETDFNKGTTTNLFANIYAGSFHLDGEFVMGIRTVPTSTDDATGVNTAWHVRGGYNIELSQSLLSPFFMYSQLATDNFGESFLQDGFAALQMFAGTTNILKAGLNWHLRQHRVRLGVHGLHVTTEPTETGKLVTGSGRLVDLADAELLDSVENAPAHSQQGFPPPITVRSLSVTDFKYLPCSPTTLGNTANTFT